MICTGNYLVMYNLKKKQYFIIRYIIIKTLEINCKTKKTF